MKLSIAEEVIECSLRYLSAFAESKGLSQLQQHPDRQPVVKQIGQLSYHGMGRQKQLKSYQKLEANEKEKLGDRGESFRKVKRKRNCMQNHRRHYSREGRGRIGSGTGRISKHAGLI